MSVRLAAIAALICGCTSQHDGPPALPNATQAAKPTAELAPVPAPTTPTPAFAPAQQGQCTPDFRLRDGVCVHGAYAPSSEQAFAQALSDYKRGAVPPMLGPRPPASSEPRAKAPLGPGSLRKQSTIAASDDAGSPKERRLAELDTMIAAAREQLRERDEAGKAKRVEEPTKKPTAGTTSSDGAPPTAVSALGSAGNAPSGSGGQDPLQARLTELSQLTNGMSVEQLKALTTQLGGMGMDPAKLDSVLKQAGAGPEYSQH